MYRLGQRHSRHLHEKRPPVSGQKLISEQSLRAAMISAAIGIIVLNILWAYTASASGKYFPWFAVIQGAAIGYAIQRNGRGLDWRFPLIAGVSAWIASFSGNLFIALLFTTTETGPVRNGGWQILQSFFENTVSSIDVVYALCAVAVATFYSRRRLNRHEVLALRKYRESQK
jgi:hypothetical protein